MGRWYRYYREPTTELGRRVRSNVLVWMLVVMGFFTFGVTWICLIVIFVLDRREAVNNVPAVQPTPTVKPAPKERRPSPSTSAAPRQSPGRYPNDFPGFREWCTDRIKRIGYKDPPAYMKVAMDTGNPGFLPTLLLQEFYGTPAFKAWKKQQQQQQQQ